MIDARLFIGELCTSCFHPISEHYGSEKCYHADDIEIGENKYLFKPCYCKKTNLIIELKIKVIEEIEIKSFEEQVLFCSNCGCPETTHFFIPKEFSGGKCDSPYCPINCLSFAEGNVFIFN